MVELICYVGFEPYPALRISMLWGADSCSAAELTFASDNYRYTMLQELIFQTRLYHKVLFHKIS